MVISGFSIGGLAGATTVQKNAAVTDDFLAFMKETPAERLQDQWLQSHHLTKEKMAAMTPDERAAITKQMQDEIRDKLKQQVEGGAVSKNGEMIL